MPVFTGTSGNDQIDGSVDPDQINGGEGDDMLYGHGSGDEIYGEGGDDQLFGGEGDDTLEGGTGNDTIGVDYSGGTTGGGDNLLTNGSFEDGTHGANGVNGLDGWSNYGGSPDAADDGTNAESWNPSNSASDGTGYITMWSQTNGSPGEGIQQTLGTPLEGGTEYTLTFDAISADSSGGWFTPNDIPVTFQVLDSSTGTVLGTTTVQSTDYQSYTVSFTPPGDVSSIGMRPLSAGEGTNPSVILDNVHLSSASGAGGGAGSGGSGDEVGNDVIDGGEGDDSIMAGSGDDTILLNNNFGNDTIVGGETGETNGDTLDMSGLTQNAVVDLTSGDPEAGTVCIEPTGATKDGSVKQTSLESREQTASKESATTEQPSKTSTTEQPTKTSTTEQPSKTSEEQPTKTTAGDGSTTTADSSKHIAQFSEIENIILGGGNDTIKLGDGGGVRGVEAFDMTVNPKGTGQTNDQLDVSAMTSDGGTTPVNTDDVTVSEDGSGNAVLTFPGGESITLVGVAPSQVSTPEQLVSIGIPPADGDPGGGTTFYDAIITSTNAAVGTTLESGTDLQSVNDAVEISQSNASFIQVGDTITVNGVTYDITGLQSTSGNLAYDGDIQAAGVEMVNIVASTGKASINLLIPVDGADYPNITSYEVTGTGAVKAISPEVINTNETVTLGEGGEPSTQTVFDAIVTSGTPSTNDTFTTADGELVDVLDGLVFDTANPGTIAAGDTVEIGGVEYTVSETFDMSTNYTYDNGTQSLGSESTGITLTNTEAGNQINLVIPTDFRSPGDMVEITSIDFTLVETAASVEINEIDDNDIVTLDVNPGANYVLHDVIVTDGTMGQGDAFLTADNELIEVLDSIAFQPQNPAGADQNAVSVGDTTVINGVTWTVDVVNTVTAAYDQTGSTAVLSGNTAQLVLSDDNGNQLDLLIPIDNAGDIENIEMISTTNIQPAGSISVPSYDTNDSVTLAVTPEREFFDFIEIATGAPAGGSILETGTDLVSVQEPVLGFETSRSQIETGDVMTIGGVEYTVSYVQSAEGAITYDGGTTTGGVKLFHIELTNGTDTVNYVIPQDGAEFPDITEINVQSTWTTLSGLGAGTIDTQETVTLDTPDTTATIYDAILTNGVPTSNETMTTANGDLIDVLEPLEVTSAVEGQINVGDTVVVGGVTYTVDAVDEGSGTYTHDNGTTTTKVDVLQLSDASGNSIVLQLPSDGAADMPNITQVTFGDISTDGTEFSEIIGSDDDDFVTLAQQPTDVNFFDFIQINSGVPQTGDVLNTGSELVEVDEPVVGSLADPSLIQLGDTFTIGGVDYTVGGIQAIETGSVTFNEGATTDADVDMVHLSLNDGSGNVLDYIVPVDAEGPLPDITQITIGTTTVAAQVGSGRIDTDDNVTLDTVAPSITVYDAIVTNGTAGVGDTFTTSAGELVSIQEPLEFNHSGAAGTLSISDTVVIGGVTYSVTQLNEIEADFTFDSGSNTTGVIKAAGVVLSDGSGGQIDLVIPLDPNADIPDITAIEFAGIDNVTTVDLVDINDDDTVTLNTATDVQLYDLIQLTAPTNGTLADLSACSDMVEVVEPVTATLQDPAVIQVGDTMTVGGVDYEVTAIATQNNSTFTYDGGQTASVNTVTFTLTAADGSEIGFIAPVDAAGPLPLISHIEVNTLSTSVAATTATLDDDNLVTLVEPDFIVEGTSGNDTIDVNYDGDPECDFIDNLDHSDGSNDDSVEAYGGDDSISSELGDDTVHAGTGNDTVTAGEGDDLVYGDEGNDWLFGVDGNDTMFGGADNDSLYGQQGDDSLLGEEGDDLILSGIGNDTADGGEGADTITGFSGDDSLLGGAGDDQIDGGSENDTIEGGTGDDVLEGGQGDDTVSGGDDQDLIFGGDGQDSLLGDAGDDTVDGGTGDDAIQLGEGDDVGIGGEGNDTMLGGMGNDSLFGDDPVAVTIGGGAAQGTGNSGANTAGVDMPAGDLTFEMQFCGDAMATTGPGTDPNTATLVSYATGSSPSEFALYAVSDNEEFDLTTPDPDDVIFETGYLTLQFNGVTYTTGITTNSILDGGDTSIAATFDETAGTVTIFVDGSFAETIALDDGDPNTTDEADPLESGGTLQFGMGQDGTGSFNGKITDARLWDDLRSDAEINEFHDILLEDEAGDANLVSNWTPDPFTGGFTDDVGGNDMAPFGDVEVVTSGNDGADVIGGGEGDDLIIGAGGDDSIEGGDDNDTILGNDGSDKIDGGAGDDSIDGGADGDSLAGNDGADTITGGSGDDSITGGAGNDLIYAADGGGEQDQVRAGDDRDIIFGDAGDFVHGGAGGDDFDTLDLTGSVSPGGSYNLVITGPDSNGNGSDGYVEYFDADGVLEGVLNFQEIELIVPCFTPGTKIKTKRGEVAVEKLRVGDSVLTADNGYQKLQWIGSKTLSGAELAAQPAYNPIRITKGALGNGLPERDMMVSPQHRMLLNTPDAALWFGSAEVLVAAKHLTVLEGIDAVEADDVTYIHIMCNAHEIVCADGTWSESFQPGDMTLAGMDSEIREEVLGLFPELDVEELKAQYQSARITLKAHEVDVLLKAS